MNIKRSFFGTATRYWRALHKNYPYSVGENGIRPELDEINFQYQKKKMAEHMLKLVVVPFLVPKHKKEVFLSIKRLFNSGDAEKIFLDKQFRAPDYLISTFNKLERTKIEQALKNLTRLSSSFQNYEFTEPKEHTLIHGLTLATVLLNRILKNMKK